MSAQAAESIWVRCDREAFEIEPHLDHFVRWAYSGELEFFGIPDDQRDRYIVLVSNLSPGVRHRKLILLSDLEGALRLSPGITFTESKETNTHVN